MDDAKRKVTMPASVSRAFAAGAPAEVLLYTLMPEKLPGRNRLPEAEAIEFFPPAYRSPAFVRRLPEVDDPSADAELVALKPDVYVDYGTVNDDYAAAVEAVQKRTGVPGILLDGALARIPDAYRRLGTAFGIAARGRRLGDAAAHQISRRACRLGAGARLPGVVWLAHVVAGRPFDAPFRSKIRSVYRDFYHLDLADAQLDRLLR